ncbi:MAG: polysaccharide biosynthesis/export family protein [Pseudomonadota bacterium]
MGLVALVLGGCTVSVGSEPGAVDATTVDGAGLAPGDRVAIKVEGEPDLSGEHELDRDGMVTLPLVGAVDAYGRTPSQLRDDVVAALADGYLRDPQVTVTMLAHRPFFIQGAVAKPGSYPFEAGMTLADAIDRAGGSVSTADSLSLRRGGVERLATVDEALRPGDIIDLQGTAG